MLITCYENKENIKNMKKDEMKIKKEERKEDMNRRNDSHHIASIVHLTICGIPLFIG